MSAPPSDEDLLAAIALHDREAFAALWERYARPVLTMAAKVLSDQHAAEDAVQDTFAAVWRAAGSFDPARGAGASWLFTIARNAVYSTTRKRRAIPVGDDLPERPDPAGATDEQAFRELESFQVHAALTELGPSSREVIELAYVEGLTQSEIAERLGLPLGTVKTRTRTALAQLAELLAPTIGAGRR